MLPRDQKRDWKFEIGNMHDSSQWREGTDRRFGFERLVLGDAPRSRGSNARGRIRYGRLIS